MGNTVTIRVDTALREALTKRADREHKTVSEVIREILENALTDRPLAERIGRLRGGLRLNEPIDGWQRRIKTRNWRP